MASQVVAVHLEVLEINSYVRGYHAYMDVWTPEVGQALLLRQEPANCRNIHAVAVFKDDVIVGHVPYNIAPPFSQFLRREGNKGFAEVTGEKVNRGAGYGLEVPCIYRLYGSKLYLDKMKKVVDSLRSRRFL